MSRNNVATIRRLTLREVAQKVVGTQLGFLHFILTPVLLLIVYTFVFSQVFAIRWGAENLGVGGFSLRLFAGLIAFNFFAEIFNRSAGLVLANNNYVKKVVFPLETLVPTAIASALVGVACNYGVFFAAYLYFEGLPTAHVVWLPLLWLPMILISAGIGWLFASLGVFVRDIGPLAGVVTTLIMFLTPIFYPLSMVPPPYAGLIALNPIASIVEEMRGVLFESRSPDPLTVAALLLTSLLIAQFGYWFFMRTKSGFADVV